MKVIILCGGKGTRLREETEFKPKPMVEIGGRPVLWHIMSMYARYGHKDFVLPLGYKGEVIKQYFHDYRMRNADFTVDLATGSTTYHPTAQVTDWRGGRAEGVRSANVLKTRFLALSISVPPSP